MNKRKNQDKEKREDILLVAESVFAERGFKGTTVREVAQKAGIANSLIFYYFKNKSLLYEAVFQNFFEQLENLIQHSMNLDMDRLGILREILFGATDFAISHRNFLRILMREIIDNGRITRKIGQDYFKPVYDTLEKFLTEGEKEALFKEVDPLHFIQSLLGMHLFYFVSEPLMRAIGVRKPYGSEEMQKRKIELWNLIRSSLT